MWESVEKKMVMWAASSAVDLDEYQEKKYIACWRLVMWCSTLLAF